MEIDEGKSKEVVDSNKTNVKKIHDNKEDSFDPLSWFLVLLMGWVTVWFFPYDSHFSGAPKVNSHYVFYFAWLTAVSTGIGALPFFFVDKFDKYYVGIANAIASGMMVAASFSLSMEGSSAPLEIDDYIPISSISRTAFGFFLGVVFIFLTKRYLDDHEELSLSGFDSTSARKIILIILVMTLHSISEGIGIGVSFGGQHGLQLGHFISFSLAVHNIPEGLAVALVLTSRKVSNIRTVVWAVFTSLPQPIMAIPAYLLIERFVPILPFGLGFAAGAMAYVSVFELFFEAWEETSLFTASIFGVISFLLMDWFQQAIKASV